MSAVTVPQTIDDPVHLLLWSADEIIPFLVCMLTGMLIDQLEGREACTLPGGGAGPEAHRPPEARAPFQNLLAGTAECFEGAAMIMALPAVEIGEI